VIETSNKRFKALIDWSINETSQDDAEVAQLEQFLFEESCRLEQAAALMLMSRARDFLKEQRVLEPAEFRIARIVGEQRARAGEHILAKSRTVDYALFQHASPLGWEQST
jgi:hypothetical protein